MIARGEHRERDHDDREQSVERNRRPVDEAVPQLGCPIATGPKLNSPV
ncbi:hypothetical protein ACFFQF_25910 [Haladaptatus pallidirubidus]